MITPTLAFAQINNNSTFADVVKLFTDIVTLATPVVGGLALLTFLWGLTKFIMKAGDAGEHEEGKNLMIWGLIALFVMFSVFGIIKFAQRDIGISNNVGGIPLLRPIK
ncbi:MAG: protein of unknown function with transrane region [Parcubacteria group bacterium]|nr:protein of unknown function with transrane region [Parcubacteria group bacterium]